MGVERRTLWLGSWVQSGIGWGGGGACWMEEVAIFFVCRNDGRVGLGTS